jgi:carbamoylphosphate synthase large subunit
VIKEAKKRGDFVLTTDIVRNTAGEFLADAFEPSVMCYEKEYVNIILEMCHKHRVDWIIPINDAELPVYAENQHLFKSADIVLLMNSKECVLAGHNKGSSWSVCERAQIRQPTRHFYGLDSINDFRSLDQAMPRHREFPIIAKPPMGVGGRGQVICNSAEDVDWLLRGDEKHVNNYIWQQ